MVQEYERIGVAGLHIEDQDLPRRCGHLGGKVLVSAKDHAAKIRAAVENRTHAETVMIARIDAIAVNGIDDAIARADAYREAGADMLFFEAFESVKQMEKVCRRFFASATCGQHGRRRKDAILACARPRGPRLSRRSFIP